MRLNISGFFFRENLREIKLIFYRIVVGRSWKKKMLKKKKRWTLHGFHLITRETELLYLCLRKLSSPPIKAVFRLILNFIFLNLKSSRSLSLAQTFFFFSQIFAPSTKNLFFFFFSTGLLWAKLFLPNFYWALIPLELLPPPLSLFQKFYFSLVKPKIKIIIFFSN